MENKQGTNNQDEAAKNANPAEDATKLNTSVKEYEQLMEESDRERTRKPGSQSNSSDQNNNGRGGGK